MRNAKKITVASIVTDRIIAMLERGVIPWRKPWYEVPAVNYVTQQPYTGINIMLLERSGEYITFNQLKKLGGWVKKGAQSYIAVQYINKESELEDPEDPNSEIKEGYRFMRYFNLFHISDCVGIESRQSQTLKIRESNHDYLDAVEQLIKNFKNVAPIKLGYKKAAYYPTRDVIQLPDPETFKNVEDYYAVTFHELIHSTGHPSRLNREGVRIKGKQHKSSTIYAKEELIAEMGAAILCTMAEIEHKTIDNSATYIKGWLKALSDDSTFIIKAAAQAQLAVNYMIQQDDRKQAA